MFVCIEEEEEEEEEEKEEEEEEEEGEEGGRGKDGKERQCKLYSIEYLIMFSPILKQCRKGLTIMH